MKYIYIIILFIVGATSYGQDIIGQWETYDDETKKKKAVIEIYENDNLYFAKIVESYVGDENAVCESCVGRKKNKPIIGLVIIENLEKDGGEYNSGTILDPENGEIYKCTLKLVEHDKLKVRGYIGFSLLGRTQYWLRKK